MYDKADVSIVAWLESFGGEVCENTRGGATDDGDSFSGLLLVLVEVGGDSVLCSGSFSLIGEVLFEGSSLIRSGLGS